MKLQILSIMFRIFVNIIMCLLVAKQTDCSTFLYSSSEVLVLPLFPSNFSLPETAGILYQPSLIGLPDLPSWLYYTYSPELKLGYVYGTPPSGQDNIKLEIIATDKSQYNISRRIFNINIADDPGKKFQIQIKISNLEVSDVLIGNRLSHLVGIIVENLWPQSMNDGSITYIKKASVMGDRLPLIPTDKEGVYLFYGSNAPFSQELKELEMEVKPLWDHRPCPKYFKKASYERHFQRRGFSVDWCSFKLLNNSNVDMEDIKLPEISTAYEAPQEIPIKLLKKSDVIKRSYILDVINTLLIPLLVMLVLLGFLTLAMCCHRSNMDLQSSIFFDEIFDDFPRVPNINEIQMVQYMARNNGSLTPKSRKSGHAESPHPSMTTTGTHIDTLPRSRTTSPTSTLNRNTPSRKFEDYETLNRPNPPPYQRP